MDLKQYFRKIREVEGSLIESFPVIVSLDTEDGGKGGVISEVSRATAAKLVVEGRAVLATEDQKLFFAAQTEAARKAAEKLELARRVQVAIIADSDLQNSVISKRTVLPGNGK